MYERRVVQRLKHPGEVQRAHEITTGRKYWRDDSTPLPSPEGTSPGGRMIVNAGDTQYVEKYDVWRHANPATLTAVLIYLVGG